MVCHALDRPVYSKLSSGLPMTMNLHTGQLTCSIKEGLVGKSKVDVFAVPRHNSVAHATLLRRLKPALDGVNLSNCSAQLDPFSVRFSAEWGQVSRTIRTCLGRLEVLEMVSVKTEGTKLDRDEISSTCSERLGIFGLGDEVDTVAP